MNASHLPPPSRPNRPYAVLFVCLGNICRSPLAEGLFIHHARQRGVLDTFTIDSCGTGGWHIGNRPDPRSIAIANKHGVDLPGHARQWDQHLDPTRFDLILAMDQSNRRTLIAASAPESRVRLMRSFDPELSSLEHTDDRLNVPDPYYGGDDGFMDVYQMLDRAAAGLHEAIVRRTG